MKARLEIPIILRRVEIHGPDGLREIDMILDTGAIYTVIAWDVAKDIGYDPAVSERRMSIITANGVIEAPLISVESIQLEDLRAEGVDVVCHDIPEIAGIEGQPAVAMFDTGGLYSYVQSSLVREAPRRAMIPPARVGLGGKEIDIHELCLVQGKIEGLDFLGDAVPVDDIGHVDGNDLNALIGALTMEQWEIRLDPRTGMLDLEGLKRREFTEF